MPELPEVETIVRDLAAPITGTIIDTAKVLKPDVLRGISPRGLLRAVRQRRIAGICRRAKHIVLLLDTGRRLVIQLRMTGNLLLYHHEPAPDERRYVVFQANLTGGARLVFRDVRRLGTISLLDEPAWQAYTGRIGPEPLGEDFGVDDLATALTRTKQAVKKALMDQRRLAGVGNIYANEALFLARIDPSRRCDRLTHQDLTSLHEATRAVLAEAVEAGGTTFRDYRNGMGEPGSYQRVLRVYGRDNQPCPRCGTRLHCTHAIDGRSTTFCWRCQGKGR